MSVRPEIPFQVITPDDVRASVRRAKKSLEKAAEEVVWQVEHEAWVTLGYSSWNAMREAEYGEAAFMVPRKQRPELVQRMRAKGLTQQEIANTAGVGIGTVNRDLSGSDLPNGSSDNAPPAAPSITNSRGQQRPATYARPEPTPDAGEFCKRCGADPSGCTCQSTSDATTGPTPASADPDPVTTTCPTCKGTGKVTR